jgi:hypothetical protein
MNWHDRGVFKRRSRTESLPTRDLDTGPSYDRAVRGHAPVLMTPPPDV